MVSKRPPYYYGVRKDGIFVEVGSSFVEAFALSYANSFNYELRKRLPNKRYRGKLIKNRFKILRVINANVPSGPAQESLLI